MSQGLALFGKKVVHPKLKRKVNGFSLYNEMNVQEEKEPFKIYTFCLMKFCIQISPLCFVLFHALSFCSMQLCLCEGTQKEKGGKEE